MIDNYAPHTSVVHLHTHEEDDLFFQYDYPLHAIQLTTPRVPAMAVSTAIRILRISL